MDLYALLKLAHILGAAVLLGTGAGIAFFMLWAHRSGDVRAIAVTAKGVVVADFVFTATAVVAQPLTGAILAIEFGSGLGEDWILVGLALYVLVGACWLPVVWLQIKMRDLAVLAAEAASELPPAYQVYFRRWFWLGWPAFLGVLAIYALMIAKPELW